MDEPDGAANLGNPRPQRRHKDTRPRMVASLGPDCQSGPCGTGCDDPANESKTAQAAPVQGEPRTTRELGTDLASQFASQLDEAGSGNRLTNASWQRPELPDHGPGRGSARLDRF